MKKYLLFIFLALFLLTGCRQQTDLYFEKDSRWQMRTVFDVDPAMMQLLGNFGGQAIAEEFGLSADALGDSDDWMSMALDLMMAEYQRAGIEAAWTRSTETYTIRMSGTSYDQLEAVLPGIALTRVNQSPETYNMTINLGFSAAELSVMTGGLVQFENTFVIHAGRILDCNGCELRGTTATWRNPATMQVTFSPGVGLPTWVFLLCGGLLVLGLIIFAIARMSQTPCPACGKRVRKGQELCPHCGNFIDFV